MAWVFEQSTGKVFDPMGMLVGFGYSGIGTGKNNPELENVSNVGPLPKGIYTIGTPFDSIDHGPFVLPLTPDPENQMFGRAGFLVHGDSINHAGLASHGCIVVARSVREDMANSLDKSLQVVDFVPPAQIET